MEERGPFVEDARKQLIEARRLINALSRSCRQTMVYLDGQSCLDKVRLKKTLQKAIHECDKFTNSV
ncbi:MAG: hypothetical protein HQ559_01390 [Lentisphaerae bacterium]|nr:hypothetical protein [Lentisphaerota bacterium]